MKTHEGSLSQACRQSYLESKDRFNEVARGCRNEIETFCAGAELSGAKLIGCLRGNEAELSPACRALTTAPEGSLLKSVTDAREALETSPCTKKYYPSCYCGDISAEQMAYVRDIRSGNRRPASSPIFLQGVPVVPTPGNRLQLRLPGRCAYFGTPGMIAMLEWLGHRMAQEYPEPDFPGPRLLVGDVSAPKGGTLLKIDGTAHLSHATGQDVDIGFILARKGEPVPARYDEEFDPHANWRFLKDVFRNPHARIEAVVVDRSLLEELRDAASSDPDWARFGPLIIAKPHHRDHFHIRIGEDRNTPGP